VLEVSKINHRFLCHLKEPQKFPLGPLDLDHSLTIQQIFKIQSILASFIANHVISFYLITPVHTDALIPAVTTPPEIIPYYRINHSIWSLSNNKEISRWMLPGLHPVNHLESQRGSKVCIKLPRRRVRSALLSNTSLPVGSNYYKPLYFDIKVNHSEFIKTAEVLMTIRYDITRGHLWCHYSASSSTHSSSQPGGISPGQTTSPESNNCSKTEYTNTQQDLPDKSYL
jgi:hypothetical protein